MDAERWREVDRIFHEVLDRQPSDRAPFLERECAGDASMRSDVEALIRSHQQAGSFLKSGMRVTAGQTFGSYQLKSLIGAGGMGEVYLAWDSKLKRDVAIKVLPDVFARDSDRVSRFQREAEVLASLSHPNIATILDLAQFGDAQMLVLELVGGETLADRIARGPVPVEEALTLAGQIADGLEAAHEKGVTHRDLKPANIKITPDGKVKVLDFGLAKAGNAPAGAALSNSPTLLCMAGTNAGVILGTAAYMAPEQAQGKPVDRRADIWAFGVVFYEMLSGRMLFSGGTTSEIMAAVMTKEPDWNALPAKLPARVRDLLRRCLIREPRRRLQAIGEARIAIEEARSGAEADGDVAPAAARGSKLWVAIAAVFFLTTIASLSLYFTRPAQPEIRVEVTTPATTDPLSFALSPDGRRLVYVASNEGKSQLWVRPLDSVAAQPLAGTDGASLPFWSPDSASVGFFAGGKLKRVDIVGGAPQALANADRATGGAWNRDGTILFAPSASGPLLKIPAAGGESVAVTRLERGQTNHRFPQFLPDGRHFVYCVLSGPSPGVYAGSLDGGVSKRLASADAAVVSPAGFLLLARKTTLFAQAFDFKRLELSGNPFPLAEAAANRTEPYSFGFSAAAGMVAYRSRSTGAAQQLTWLDRSGKSVGTIGAADTAGFTDVELSPDGRRVAVYRAVNGNTDVWLIDAVRGVPARFTFDAAVDQRPVWSPPDGSRVVFQSGRKGVFNLYWKLASGAGAEELLLESDQNKMPNDWSADGRFLLFRSLDPQTSYDLWVLPVTGDNKPLRAAGSAFPFLKTPFDERDGQFSPDGKWIAYQSNESGHFEIYVQPFPGPGGKFQISTNGGSQPRWNKNGKEIFYVSLDSKMMAAPVKTPPDGQSLERGTPSALFPVRIAGGPVQGLNKQQYAVSADGQRFLVNLAADEGTLSPITLIYNWKPQPSK